MSLGDLILLEPRTAAFLGTCSEPASEWLSQYATNWGAQIYIFLIPFCEFKLELEHSQPRVLGWVKCALEKFHTCQEDSAWFLLCFKAKQNNKKPQLYCSLVWEISSMFPDCHSFLSFRITFISFHQFEFWFKLNQFSSSFLSLSGVFFFLSILNILFHVYNIVNYF